MSVVSLINRVLNSAFVADSRPSFPSVRVRNALMCRHARAALEKRPNLLKSLLVAMAAVVAVG